MARISALVVIGLLFASSDASADASSSEPVTSALQTDDECMNTEGVEKACSVNALQLRGGKGQDDVEAPEKPSEVSEEPSDKIAEAARAAVEAADAAHESATNARRVLENMIGADEYAAEAADAAISKTKAVVKAAMDIGIGDADDGTEGLDAEELAKAAAVAAEAKDHAVNAATAASKTADNAADSAREAAGHADWAIDSANAASKFATVATGGKWVEEEEGTGNHTDIASLSPGPATLAAEAAESAFEAADAAVDAANQAAKIADNAASAAMSAAEAADLATEKADATAKAVQAVKADT